VPQGADSFIICRKRAEGQLPAPLLVMHRVRCHGLSEDASVEILSAFDVSATTPLSLTGDSNSNSISISGNAGANFLQGGAGKDALDGGGGDDTLSGGDADDRNKGGSGLDTVVFSGRKGETRLPSEQATLSLYNSVKKHLRLSPRHRLARRISSIRPSCLQFSSHLSCLSKLTRAWPFKRVSST
jgi:hypothetical protein